MKDLIELGIRLIIIFAIGGLGLSLLMWIAICWATSYNENKIKED